MKIHLSSGNAHALSSRNVQFVGILESSESLLVHLNFVSCSSDMFKFQFVF